MVIRRTASATMLDQSVPVRAPSAKVTSYTGDGSWTTSSGGPPSELAGRDCRHPGGVAAAADDHVRDHQLTRILVGEPERPEADQPGARYADLVADHRGRRQLLPPGHGLLEAVATSNVQPGGDAPADVAVAPPYPRESALVRQMVQQMLRDPVHRLAANHQLRCGASGREGRTATWRCTHEMQAYASRPGNLPSRDQLDR